MTLIEALADADAGFTGLDANAAEARFMEKVYPGVVTSATLFECIVTSGWYGKIIRLAKSDIAPDDQVDAAVTVLALLADRERQINYASATAGGAMVALLNALVAGGALDTTTKNTILGLGQNLRTRAEFLGLTRVTARDIHLARGGI